MLKKKLKSAASFTPIRFSLLCVPILCCLGLLLVRVGWLQMYLPDNLVKQEDMRSPARRTYRGWAGDDQRPGRTAAGGVRRSGQRYLDRSADHYGAGRCGLRAPLAGDGRSAASQPRRAGPSGTVIPTLAFSIWRVRSIPSRQSGSINCICQASTCAMNRDGFTRLAGHVAANLLELYQC